MRSAPVRSGSLKERRLIYSTFDEFYHHEYLPALKGNFPQRSISTVIRWITELEIKRCKFDRYRCEKCFEGRKLESMVLRNEGTQQQKQTYLEWKEHNALVMSQMEKSKEDKQVKKPDVVTIVYDYTTFHELSKEKVRDLGMFVLHNGKTYFLDHLATHAHDHNFTTKAWDIATETLKENGMIFGEIIQYLVVWSDGGLKTKENLFYFHQMAVKSKIQVTVNFFAPYHGHSEVRLFIYHF